MSNTPEPTPPGSNPGTTRIVAGESSKPKRRRTLEIGIAVGLVLLIGAGAAVASVVAKNNETQAAASTSPAAELRLGYFGNVTHAPALVGVSKGIIAGKLGGTKLSTQIFNAGPAAVEALNAGAIDA
ncbi:ABC transporter substrate-binding protein, partial [Arthrobacter sp. efr-133-R2A-120]